MDLIKNYYRTIPMLFIATTDSVLDKVGSYCYWSISQLLNNTQPPPHQFYELRFEINLNSFLTRVIFQPSSFAHVHQLLAMDGWCLGANHWPCFGFI